MSEGCFGLSGGRGARRGRLLLLVSWALLVEGTWMSACLDRPIGAVPPVTTNVFVDRVTQTSVDKIDLLFMIDNSASMSDKQAILRLAVPDLVERLVTPACIDGEGNRGSTPPPGAPCAAGETREFNAIENINVAVVSSSLGDAGANRFCPPSGSPGYVPERIDLAHLVGSLPRGQRSGANEHGFLEWRAETTAPGTFSEQFQRMVESVGETGCGWEASLESWYRFLIDPFPYRGLVRVACAGSRSGAADCVQPETDADGQVVLDQTLLGQRAAFLRPDSLVAIIMLSDENDCSVAAGGASWAIGDTGRRMNRASSACEADPNAACCYMCGTRPPEGCSADPVCEVAASPSDPKGRLQATADGINLRCFDQKRRFGHDFLYPTARYVNALQQRELCFSRPDLGLDGCPASDRVVSPLFAGGRDRSLVFLGGIVGVPWQSIVSDVDQNGRALTPDALRFKTAGELELDGTWPTIVGSASVPPTNPVMIESQFARPGVSVGNPVNGREFVTDGKDQPGTPMDLEYACIFPLPEQRNCAERDPLTEECDCYQGDLNRPLCEAEPGVSAPGTIQYWAKAYPGTRQLEVLRDYGENSIVASICARNVDIATAATRADFGYRPAVDAIVERLKARLGDRCLPRGLLTAADESVPCTLVEAVPQPSGQCECDPAIARTVPDARTSSLIRAELARDPLELCGADDPQRRLPVRGAPGATGAKPRPGGGAAGLSRGRERERGRGLVLCGRYRRSADR